MAQELYVRRLIIPPGVIAKVRDERDLTEEEMRDAVEDRRLRFRWGDHPTHGRRALVFTEIAEEIWFLALHPAIGEDADVWKLRTAYPVAAA